MVNAVTPADMATYLNAEFDQNDTNQCQMFINDVVTQALTIVCVGDVDPNTGPTHANLPDAAGPIIRGAVKRLMLNINDVSYQMAGSFTSSPRQSSGSLLSKAERNALRAAAGRGGAFSVDMLAGTDWAQA